MRAMEIRLARIDELEEFVGVFDQLWPNHLGLSELRRDLELMPEKQRMSLWFAVLNGENRRDGDSTLNSDRNRRDGEDTLGSDRNRRDGEDTLGDSTLGSDRNRRDGDSTLTIGIARLYRLIGEFHPEKWFTEFGILPEHRGKGYGRQLYDHLIYHLSDEKAIEVKGRVRDDDPYSIGFLERRGFYETKRDFESVLNLSELSGDLLDELDNGTFDIRTAKEADCERFRHQWHELFEEARKDIPRDDSPTSFTFDEFAEIFFVDEEFMWDVSMFAFDGDRMTGFTLLYGMDDRGVLFQALTGVDKEYRGRGIAKAIKARAMRRAKEKGVTEVHCDNDTRTAPMIHINELLGYKSKPGMIAMRKDLRTDA
jgi:GNAT superfamily N-acetyltransferase